jgi:hypothetical protein
VLERTKLFEKKYYGTSPIDESEQDSLMKQMSEKGRAKIIELRSQFFFFHRVSQNAANFAIVIRRDQSNSERGSRKRI